MFRVVSICILFDCHLLFVLYYVHHQEASGASVHEEDDGDEFILLGMHQLTVIGYCFHTLRAACSLLASHRPAVQSASLQLITSTLILLRLCVCPHVMWEAGEEPLQRDSVAGRLLHVGGEKMFAYQWKVKRCLLAHVISEQVCTCEWRGSAVCTTGLWTIVSFYLMVTQANSWAIFIHNLLIFVMMIMLCLQPKTCCYWYWNYITGSVFEFTV